MPILNSSRFLLVICRALKNAESKICKDHCWLFVSVLLFVDPLSRTLIKRTSETQSSPLYRLCNLILSLKSRRIKSELNSILQPSDFVTIKSN